MSSADFISIAHRLLRQKLRPFFPPLAPLQSINLRAALYRGLTELKKNGIFGREVILRKTMLDECKGDKFEEVLRLFAVAVLREEARRRLHSTSATPTRYIEVLTAPEDLSTEQRERLLPLLLAHRKGLQGQLNKSRRLDGEFRDEMRHLEDARVKLKEKRKAMLERERQLPSITQQELDSISNGVQAAWTGNEQWAEVLLRGGPSNLELPLTGNSTRDGAQQICGTTENEPLTHPPNNLLAGLNEKIEKHHSRLRKWTEFRDSMEKSRKDPKGENPVELRKPLLNFSAHQGLRPGIPRRDSVVSAEKVAQVPSSHFEIIEAMRADLANLRGYNSLRKLPTTKPNSQYYLKEDVSQKHNSTTTISNAVGPLGEGIQGDSEIFHGDGTTGQSNRQAAEYDVWQQDVFKDGEDYFSHVQSDGTEGASAIGNTHTAQQPLKPNRASIPKDSVEQSNTSLPEASKCHFTEASIIQLSPVFRNRHDEVSSATLTQGNLPSSPQSRQLLHSQITPEQPTDPFPTKSQRDIFSPANFPPSYSPPKAMGITLLERTRQSMALLPSSTATAPLKQAHQTPTSQNNHHQKNLNLKHPRRSSSSSTTFPQTHSTTATIPKHPQPPTRAKTTPNPKFPTIITISSKPKAKAKPPTTQKSSSASSSVFHYSTPRRRASNRDQDPDADAGVDLFSEQADYASVFKSRPRVAVSPPAVSSSPERNPAPEGGE